MGVFHWPLLLPIDIFFVLIVFYSIGKIISNTSTVTDLVTFGIFGSFQWCDGELYSDYLVVSEEASYLYLIWTFAFIFLVTGSKSYLSKVANGIPPMYVRMKNWRHCLFYQFFSFLWLYYNKIFKVQLDLFWFIHSIVTSLKQCLKRNLKTKVHTYRRQI